MNLNTNNNNITFFYDISEKNEFKKLENPQNDDPTKRHVGLPDHGGIQRILQTGAIATALHDNHKERFGNKFDVIFATYHTTPPRARVVRPEDKKCIEEYRKQAKEGMKILHICEGECKENCLAVLLQ